MDDEISTVINPAIDAAIDFVTKSRSWRKYFIHYNLGYSAKQWYGNCLKFILLSSVIYSGTFMYFWDRVMTITNLSVSLIGIILIMDPIWNVTAPESHENLRAVKTALFKILDVTLAAIVIVVESLRMLIKAILVEQVPKKDE